MKIIFKKLTIENFMSFEKAELSLDNAGYFIIRGVNNNIEDSASSNGSGKSTIFESLCWVLTGETIRGTKDVSNIYSNKGAIVELQFNVDKDEYVIIRKKDPSSLLFYVNGEDKSGKGIRDTEKLLSQYLPDLSSSLIGSVVVLGQGLPQRFTNNSPSGRKEILEKLSKSDFMIADLKEKVSKRKSDLNIQLRKVEDNNLTFTTNKKYLEDSIKNVKTKLKELESIEDLQRELNNYKEGFNGHLNAKNILEEQLNTCDNDLIELKKLLEEFNFELEEKQKEINNKYNSEISDIVSEIIEIQSDEKAVELEISRIKSIKDVCPTCGQKLQGVEKPSTVKLENRRRELVNSYNELKSLYDKKVEEQDKELKNSCSKLISDVESVKEKINSKEKELKSVNDFIKENEKLLQTFKENIIRVEQSINGRDKLYKTYEEDLNDYENKISKLDEDILYNNNEHDLLSKRIEVVNRMFSALNKEFRGYLLTNVIQYINKVSKEYCNQVFKNKNIEFKLDGNNISISYCGKEYENLSGGEKQKIDIIIQFAIRNMLSKYLNFSSNILVLDEITDFLDQQGVEAIVTLITENLKDTSAIYFITHHENLMFPYDNEIMVVKNNNISSLFCK